MPTTSNLSFNFITSSWFLCKTQLCFIFYESLKKDNVNKPSAEKWLILRIEGSRTIKRSNFHVKYSVHLRIKTATLLVLVDKAILATAGFVSFSLAKNNLNLFQSSNLWAKNALFKTSIYHFIINWNLINHEFLLWKELTRGREIIVKWNNIGIYWPLTIEWTLNNSLFYWCILHFCDFWVLMNISIRFLIFSKTN